MFQSIVKQVMQEVACQQHPSGCKDADPITWAPGCSGAVGVKHFISSRITFSAGMKRLPAQL